MTTPCMLHTQIYTENLCLAITTEDSNEAVQSSDPFPSIIHPARGDRGAGLLFSERPRNPIYSHEQREMQCRSGVNQRRVKTKVGRSSAVSWVHKNWDEPSGRYCKSSYYKSNKNTKCGNITDWAHFHQVQTDAMLSENEAAWPELWGENTLWRHCVSGRQNWQAATDNNIWNKFDVWNSICSDRDGCSIRVKL